MSLYQLGCAVAGLEAMQGGAERVPPMDEDEAERLIAATEG